MPSISIEALLAARDHAQRIYREMGEQVRVAQEQLGRYGVSLPDVEVEFPGSQYLRIEDERNSDAINREIDRFVWMRLFQLTNIDTIMDHKTRRDLFEQLSQSQAYRRHQRMTEGEEFLPELTEENIRAVFQGVQDNQLEYFERCVESVYRALSWDHKTNEPGCIGKKLITTQAFHDWSRSLQGDTVTLNTHEHIHDLERVLCILNGDVPPTHESPGLRTVGAVPYGKWIDVPHPTGKDPLFSIICYRKGTSHIKIHKKELRDEMNRIMAHRYPGAIAEPQGARRSQWGSTQAQRPKTSTALAKTDKAARQAFYTPPELAAEIAAKAIGGESEGWGVSVLEPSAGEGSLVRAALRTRCRDVVAIENDPTATELLGYLAERVHQHDEDRLRVDPRDFFDVTPASYPDGFDVVMMNPPFSNAQEVEHVLHAWEFVKPGGKLVAIMSASAEHRATGRYKAFRDFCAMHGGSFTDNPAGAFKDSGTNVNTVTFVVRKPE
jgi:predicted RNA methylase